MVSIALVLAACTSADESGSEGCAWPADLTSIGVLQAPDEVIAVDVHSGQIKVRCKVTATTAGSSDVPLEADGVRYNQSTAPVDSIVMPDLSPDLRSIVVEDGVVELAGLRLTKVGNADWKPASLPGNGRVLMSKRPNGVPNAADYIVASGWCLLPALDAPAERCAPISDSTAQGTPVIHTDGTVGWATSTGVPFRAGALSAWAQTDGKRLVRAEVLPPAKKPGGSGILLDASGMAGWIDPSDVALAFNERVSDQRTKRISWFVTKSIAADGVTAELYRSPVTDMQLAGDIDSAYGNSMGRVYGVRVMGEAIVLTVQVSSDVVAVVRVGMDGAVRKLATLPGSAQAKIISWPVA
ncbi:hypothetical protein LWC34_01935 [Kibdelosporangium philippinense]|uniref:Uncharacterized protein n=1 Tax=Kibdelosporangium philippinense TaxID=211113 RepID=A0ABS8Z4V2_9PSEU|nr:hypothetical protein [Kibdelosporangium philippinense]MCE7001608.1 hypothetical protein [Kibdelosporangium philippinense]